MAPVARILNPNATAAIVLGAQSWSRATNLASTPAFARSASDIRDYLTNIDRGLGLKEDDILWLFDSNMPAPSQIDEIGTFLKRWQIVEGSQEPRKIQDVFVYYVGHGSYPENSNQLFMLVRSSDPDLWDTTCLLASSLVRRIARTVPFSRQMFVIDCCFSGAAQWAWQAAGETEGALLRRDIESKIPSRGAAFLCSSGAEMVSIAPANSNHTMFTGALLDALAAGLPVKAAALSVRDVRDLTWEFLQRKWGAAAVRPVIVSFDRGEGEVADLRAFPNISDAAETTEVHDNPQLMRSQLEKARAERRELLRLANRSGELDKDAEQFEGALLAYLSQRYGASFRKAQGTNSEYYVSESGGRKFKFSVIGRMKNTSTPAEPGQRWLLRVEEDAPPDFALKIGELFEPSSAVTRRMTTGEMRFQWMSTDYRGGLPHYKPIV